MRYLWAALTALAVIRGTVLTVRLLRQRNGACSKRTALASGSLTLSVLFYAGPRVLDAFWKDDLAAVCGLGRLLAAVGVTLFALLLYWIWESRFSPAVRDRAVFWTAVGFAVGRLLLLAASANHWLTGETPVLWATLRAAALAGQAAADVLLWFLIRDRRRALRPVWLLAGLAFLLALPTLLPGLPFADYPMAASAVCAMLIPVCLYRDAQ